MLDEAKTERKIFMLQDIKNKLNMNLQLLAGEGEEGTETNSGQGEGAEEQTQVNEGSEDNQENTITMTQEQLNSMFDKKYAQWKKKSEKEIQEKAKEVEEAEKLKRMSEQERQQAEIKKQLDGFNKMKSEMAREKLLNQTSKELSTRNLPIEFSEFVMAGDSETTMERLNVFNEKFTSEVKKEVDRQVNERLKGTGNFQDTHLDTKTSNVDTSKMSDDEFYRNYFTNKK